MKNKRSILLLFCLIGFIRGLQGNNSTEEQISFDFIRQPLRVALQQLSEKEHLNFIFDDALIDDVSVTCQAENESPHSALKKLLKPYRFSYEFLTQNTVIIRPAGEPVQPCRVLNGCVLDAETGAPLKDANAYIQGQHIGSATDLDGRFTLAVPDSTLKLIVSYMGYETEIRQITPESNVLDIRLNPRVFEFNSIRVIAPLFPEEIERISREQLNEENFIGVVGVVSTEMNYSSFMSYNDNHIYYNGGTNGDQLYIKITGNRLHPMIGSDRNNRLAFNQHQVQLNGFHLQMPFHTTIVPAMNPGIVDYDLVENSGYYTSVFDVSYANAYESVMDLHYRKGNPNKICGKARADLSNLSFVLEGPLTSKAAWIVHGKKSHLNDLLSSIDKNKWMSLRYHDMQAQLDYQPAGKQQIRFSAIRSTDRVAFDPQMNYLRERMLTNSSYTQSTDRLIRTEEQIHETNFDDNRFLLEAVSIEGLTHISDHWKSEYSIVWADQQYENSRSWSVEHNARFPDVSDSTYNYLWSEGINGRFDAKSWTEQFVLHYDRSSAYSMKAGFQCEQLRYTDSKKDNLLVRIEESVSEPPNYNRSFHEAISLSEYACFYQEERNLFTHLHLQSGLRYDGFTLGTKGRFNPRFMIQTDLPKRITAKIAYGTFSKLPDFGEMRQHMLKHFEPGYKTGDSKIEFQTVRKIQTGIEKLFGFGLTLNLNYFYKDMDRLIPVQRLSDGSLLYDVENRAHGFSRGFDVNAMLTCSRISMTGRYQYTDSYERVEDQESYPYYLDQRHSCSFSFNAPLPGDWHIGLQAVYGSGYAYTPCLLPEYDWDLGYDRDSTPIWEFQTDDPNSAWYPPYYRLDATFRRRFNLPYGSMALSIDLINVLNIQHTFTYIYTYDQNGTPVRKSESLIPFFPQVEVIYEF